MRAMKKLLFISALLLLVLVSCGEQKGEYVQISGYAQGGSYTVKMNMKGVGENRWRPFGTASMPLLLR